MTPTLAVGFGAAADGTQVKCDQDCTLLSVQVGATAATTRAVLSRDPKATIANTLTAPATQLDENLMAIVLSGTPVVMSVPLSAGQSVFVSANAACQVILNFQLLIVP
jgi:hypothetical protein